MTRSSVVAVGIATLIVAGAAHADLLPASAGAPVQAICQPWVTSPCVARVGASLRSERSGLPVSGKRLWFFSRGAPICSSVTDRGGVASCRGIAPSGRALADSGYHVVFEGDGHYQPTTVRAR